MAISEQDLVQIGEYVKTHLGEWVSGQAVYTPTERDFKRELDLHERIVRVEEELKSQRELMRQGFAQMDKRFEQVEKRFTFLTWLFAAGFLLLNGVVLLVKFVG